MRRIAILFLLLTGIVFGQNKYFIPVPVQQSNGRPINNANVDLYTAGTSTKVYDLTYLDNSAGSYYYTSAITTGFYDIYVNGVAWKTYIYINSSNQNTSTIALATIEANDTTELKAMTAYGDTSTTRFLLQLASGNTNGGGLLVEIDSAYSEGVYAFDNATAGKQWARIERLNRDIVNVKWAGAKGDSSNNDREEIQLTFDRAQNDDIIIFPEGKYLIDSVLTITKPLTLELDPKAWLILTDSVRSDSGYSFIKIDTTNVYIKGGNFKGTWKLSQDASLTGYGNNSGRKHREYGIHYNFNSNSVSDSGDIVIDGANFYNWAHAAIRVATTSTNKIGNIRFVNCDFYNNHYGINLQGYGNIESVELRNLYIDKTAFPHSSVAPSSSYGGNGIFTENVRTNLLIDNVITKDNGREGIEVWYSARDSIAKATKNTISNSKFGYSQFRTISCSGKNLKFINNVVEDSISYTELVGENIVVANNTFYGGQLRTQGLGDSRFKGWVVDGNTWYSVSNKEPIYINTAQNWKFTNNNIFLDNGGSNNFCRFNYLTNSEISGNFINITTDMSATQVTQIKSLWACNITNNVVTVDSGLTSFNATVWGFGNLFFSNFENNIVNVHTNNASGTVAMLNIACSKIDTLNIYSSDGSTWTLEARAQGWRNAPQAGDSVNGNWYVIRDSVAVSITGAFVGQGGKLAKYNAGWEFYTIDHIISDPDKNADNVFDYPVTFPNGANLDTLLLVEEGVIGNTFRNNRIDALNSFTPSSNNNQDAWFTGTSSQAVFWNNEFDEPTYGINPTSGGLHKNFWRPLHLDAELSTIYYWRGQIIFYRMPSSGDKIGKVCTVSGKSGTWVEWGVTD